MMIDDREPGEGVEVEDGGEGKGDQTSEPIRPQVGGRSQSARWPT